MNFMPAIRRATEFMSSKLQYPDGAYNRRTISEIRNAWLNGSGLDEADGYLWIDAKELHKILRTSKENVNAIMQRLNKKEKQKVLSETFVYGPSVMKLLSESVGTANTLSKEKYLKVSIDYYHEIEFSDTARLIRAEAREATNNARKQLKAERIKTHKIANDELTGKPLQSGSQFSHIRSFHIFNQIGLMSENGLVVNSDTHKLITQRSVVDEEGLLSLCNEQGWSTDWYEPYCRWLSDNKLDSVSYDEIIERIKPNP